MTMDGGVADITEADRGKSDVCIDQRNSLVV